MKTLLLTDLNSIESRMFEQAFEVRKFAYAPYSGYTVGASVLGVDGHIYTGCNIESSDFTLTSHAEAVAIDSMVKSGCLNLTSLLIVLIAKDAPALPCGLCRQKISEFSTDSNIKIIAVNLNNNNSISKIFVTNLDELLPYRFTSKQFLSE